MVALISIHKVQVRSGGCLFSGDIKTYLQVTNNLQLICERGQHQKNNDIADKKKSRSM